MSLNNKCKDRNYFKGKPIVFMIVGMLSILVGVGLLFDRELSGDSLFFVMLIAIGVTIMLAGVFGVCFLDWSKKD